MVPIVEFVQFDANLVLMKETWQATKLFCPRCGAGNGLVWVDVGHPPENLNGIEMRAFVCVQCEHVALGLNGFAPKWDAKDRIKQILLHGFGAESE